MRDSCAFNELSLEMLVLDGVLAINDSKQLFRGYFLSLFNAIQHRAYKLTAFGIASCS